MHYASCSSIRMPSTTMTSPESRFAQPSQHGVQARPQQPNATAEERPPERRPREDTQHQRQCPVVRAGHVCLSTSRDGGDKVDHDDRVDQRQGEGGGEGANQSAMRQSCARHGQRTGVR